MGFHFLFNSNIPDRDFQFWKPKINRSFHRTPVLRSCIKQKGNGIPFPFCCSTDSQSSAAILQIPQSFLRLNTFEKPGLPVPEGSARSFLLPPKSKIFSPYPAYVKAWLRSDHEYLRFHTVPYIVRFLPQLFPLSLDLQNLLFLLQQP